jgi:hypothetical protein
MQLGFLLEIAEEQIADRHRRAAAMRLARAVARAKRRPAEAGNAQVQTPMSPEVQAHAAAQAREMSGVSR